MFSDFLSRLTQPKPAPLVEDDARLALTALLVRIARSDNDYADTEMAQIDRISAERYGLSPFETASLRTRAEDLEATPPTPSAHPLHQRGLSPMNDRLAVVQALWSVALADEQRTDEEDSLLRLVVSLLGVNDVDSALARHKGEQGLHPTLIPDPAGHTPRSSRAGQTTRCWSCGAHWRSISLIIEPDLITGFRRINWTVLAAVHDANCHEGIGSMAVKMPPKLDAHDKGQTAFGRRLLIAGPIADSPGPSPKRN